MFRSNTNTTTTVTSRRSGIRLQNSPMRWLSSREAICKKRSARSYLSSRKIDTLRHSQVFAVYSKIQECIFQVLYVLSTYFYSRGSINLFFRKVLEQYSKEPVSSTGWFWRHHPSISWRSFHCNIGWIGHRNAGSYCRGHYTF